MTSIIMTNETPSTILAPVSPTTHDIIQKAKRILFYYKGGRDVVSITKKGEAYWVYVPQVSTLESPKASKAVSELYGEINAEMTLNKIGDDRPFLFDVETKKILEISTFIDFIPYYTIKHCLFLVENDDGINTRVRFLDNRSDYGVLQFLPLLIAKRELLSPKKGTYTNTGKKLLSYLVSERYSKPGSFLYETGCWDGVDYTIGSEKKDIPIDITTMDCDRAIELSATINPMEGYTIDGEILDDKEAYSRLLLTDLLQVGVDSFFNGVYKETIEFEVDIMKETYKSVTIDTNAFLCFVGLQPGVELRLEQLREDFQSDNVQILT